MMRNLPTVVAFFSDCTDVDYAIDACHRFCAGVVHSFTDSAEDRDKLLSFSNLYIGHCHVLILLSLFIFLLHLIPEINCNC